MVTGCPPLLSNQTDSPLPLAVGTGRAGRSHSVRLASSSGSVGRSLSSSQMGTAISYVISIVAWPISSWLTLSGTPRIANKCLTAEIPIARQDFLDIAAFLEKHLVGGRAATPG